ncbi:MAG TPA: C-terminal binding protein [Microvirga sp.]|jgi:D-3-phosphoglycerate dehydrogenase/C-terminal binding protein|nr:C-terminal binding protein [Microvirga sp.]
MLLLLSHSRQTDHAPERALATGRAELFIQRHDRAAEERVPAEVRARADAIVHDDANTDIDGSPADYPHCRIVVRAGVGYDGLDVEAWSARGVPVCNVPDYGTSEVADHAIALMLSLARGCATYHEALRRDPKAGWSHAAAPLVRRLRGAAFGIVGLGRIGLAAALRARAFGMSIAFYDPYLPSGVEIAVDAARFHRLEDLMAASDVVSLHAPAAPETRGLVGREALAAAKPGLVLVNTARGSLVDLDALHDALRDGRVAGAALDVLPREPADADHPLIAAWLRREPWIEGRLTLSPHAAFYSPDGNRDLRTKSVETALTYLETGRLMNCVNGPSLNSKQAGR